MALSQQMAQVAKHFWGEPSSATNTELRWGNHGSKSVNLAKGVWYDHELDVGGGVIDLIKREMPSLNGSIPAILEKITGLQSPQPIKQEQTTYNYQDKSGQTKYQVIRYEPKTFRQRRVENGKAIWGLQGVSLLPYRLPNIINNPQDKVFIVEGEKDVKALEDINLVATCNSGGSGNWKPEISAYLRDRDCIILPDNDAAGKKHGRDVFESLQNIAKSVKIIQLPGLKEKEDPYDWLQTHNKEELLQVINQDQDTPISIMTIQDIMMMPPTPWLIQDFIPENSMTMIYGSPGSGKTFLALDMALHIAHNKEWHGKNVRPGLVIYIAGEGVGGLRKRLKAWNQAHKNEPGLGLRIVPLPIGLLDEDEIQALIQTIQQIKNDLDVRLVVFDTVARCMAGDENSAQDMGLAIKAMDKIRETFKCAVMPNHHSGKDRDRGARGSTALIGAVDVSLRVDRQDDILLLSTEKQKDAEAQEQVVFHSRVITLEENEEYDLSEPETSIVLSLHTDQDVKLYNSLTPPQRMVFNALQMAIDEAGISSPNNRVPGRCTTIELWRAYSMHKTISEGEKEDSKRKAFQRSAKSLIEKNIVSKWNDYVWLVRTSRTRQLGQVSESEKQGE